MDALLAPVVMALGVLAGAAGALLGLGGGIFLVPALVAGFHLPFPVVRGISLMTVIATSTAVAAGSAGRAVTNLRLAMVLQVMAAIGGLAGGLTAKFIPDRVLTWGFALLMAGIAGVMITRLERRNVILDPEVSPGIFGGRFHEHESGGEVVYRVKRLPLALGITFFSGCVSSLLGLGGGIVMVPALNAWCGVPMRVAAATSTVMIGITAVAAAPIYYARGEVVPHLAAAAVLGVLAGSQAGMRVGVRLRARRLKQLMIAVLLAVSAAMVVRGLQ